MATAKRNIKEVITTEGEKLNNTADKDKKSEDTSNTQQDLAAIVSDLKTALEAATKREDTLQKQISSLQTEMNDQKVHMEKLEKIELKAELDEAKQAALKLAEKNSELEAEIKALKGGGQLARRSNTKVDTKGGKKTDSKGDKHVAHTIFERPIGKSHLDTNGQYSEPMKMWLD